MHGPNILYKEPNLKVRLSSLRDKAERMTVVNAHGQSLVESQVPGILAIDSQQATATQLEDN